MCRWVASLAHRQAIETRTWAEVSVEHGRDAGGAATVTYEGMEQGWTTGSSVPQSQINWLHCDCGGSRRHGCDTSCAIADVGLDTTAALHGLSTREFHGGPHKKRNGRRCQRFSMTSSTLSKIRKINNIVELRPCALRARNCSTTSTFCFPI